MADPGVQPPEDWEPAAEIFLDQVMPCPGVWFACPQREVRPALGTAERQHRRKPAQRTSYCAASGVLIGVPKFVVENLQRPCRPPVCLEQFDSCLIAIRATDAQQNVRRGRWQLLSFGQRRGAPQHAAYLSPMLRPAVRWSAAKCPLCVDGLNRTELDRHSAEESARQVRSGPHQYLTCSFGCAQGAEWFPGPGWPKAIAMTSALDAREDAPMGRAAPRSPPARHICTNERAMLIHGGPRQMP